jgi:sulfocyanin
MKKYAILSVLACAVFAACGGGESADAPASGGAASAPAAPAAPTMPTGEMMMPDWFQIDADAQTVTMTLTAGTVSDNNYWNFNGATKGGMAITVPEGYAVTIEFVNSDPVMAHSLGISAETTTFGAMPEPIAVFEGAMSANPGSMMESTMPGQSETIQFVADAAGNYSIVCYIAGHAVTGMWIYFNVSADGTAGVQQ